MGTKAVAFLATSRAAESRRFYEEVVGLKFLDEHEFAVTFDAFGTTLRLQKTDTVVVAPYTSFGLDVDDLDAAVDTLEMKGVRGKRYAFLEQDSRGIWAAPSGARVFWFEDPDGNLLSFSQGGV
jgi:catechol 2,3-dioxygenase-like lactoylglutathione lyase family enzyme